MKVRVWVGIVMLAGLTGAALGADKAKKAAAGPPDEKAMMDAMTKAGTPGDAHKKLEPLIGTFDTKVKMWMDPSKPAEESSGTSVNKWVLGNRWVEQRFEGTFMGQPFSGIGYTGYDNVKKKYVGTWMDSASTAMMTSMGTADASGKMTMVGMMDDPMTRKSMKVTTKFSMADPDSQVMEMWCPGPTGKVYKMMEITYTRKK